MGDEDKEKAEKLAAAKKRFEELKKQQAKKGKKGGKKKDKDAAEAKGEAETEALVDEAAADDGEAIEADEKAVPQVSEATKAKVQRSESSASAHSEVRELYKKQAAKIEELEKENRGLKEQHDDHTKKLAKTEEELESLREGSGDAAELKAKANEAERLRTELAAVQRQLSQAQQAAAAAAVKGPTRRQSGASPDVSEQLASKDSAIHSLELDISNLRNHITTLQNSVAERHASVQEANERTTAAQAATDAAKQELESLKLSIAIPSDETAAANEDPEALTKRITVLESNLRSATTDLEAAAKRATSLEQKIEALTKLHRDSLNTAQTKDRELNHLRSQLKRQSRPSHVRDASEFELNDEETELGGLQTRIRALEAENFDLRRGVWRDRRAELQPGMDDNNYEDVDLATPYSATGHGGSLPRQKSTFQDVITSGINAFTGREPSKPPARDRAMSMGLMSEDDFDEESFRLAQEQEQKNRIERIKAVKRGLEQWKGWRVDIEDLRQKGAGPGREVGPAFEV